MKKAVGSFSTGAVLSWFVDWLINDKKKQHKWLVVKGWHVHHSVYGLLVAAAAGLVPLVPSKKIQKHRKALQELLVALGLGVVAEHTASEGFKFVEKETEEDKKKRLQR